MVLLALLPSLGQMLKHLIAFCVFLAEWRHSLASNILCNMNGSLAPKRRTRPARRELERIQAESASAIENAQPDLFVARASRFSEKEGKGCSPWLGTSWKSGIKATLQGKTGSSPKPALSNQRHAKVDAFRASTMPGPDGRDSKISQARARPLGPGLAADADKGQGNGGTEQGNGSSAQEGSRLVNASMSQDGTGAEGDDPDLGRKFFRRIRAWQEEQAAQKWRSSGAAKHSSDCKHNANAENKGSVVGHGAHPAANRTQDVRRRTFSVAAAAGRYSRT